MQINNILNCQKPKSFTGLKETGKVRYKHYEEMPDEMLSAYSMLKAKRDVSRSGKSKLLKAMPAITSTIIATSLALTQPGKLSTRMKSGVGFLVLLSGVNFLGDKLSKLAYNGLNKDNKDVEKASDNKLKAGLIGTVGALGAILGGGALLVKNKDKILNSNSKPVQFLKEEAQKLASEINNSKLGKLVEEKLNPFMSKHQKGFRALKNVLPFGAIIAGSVASDKLSDSLSKDFSQKTLKNYIKGKAAQQDARAHFDSIDAIEV